MSAILAFSGSARKSSFNQKLVAIAADGAKNAGAQVTLINLADFPMPLFNQDLESEQGLPANAVLFKRMIAQSDGLLIASPEYNSAFSPLLKNAIDWASRQETENEPPLSAFRGKMAAIMAASPGNLGGLRGLVFLRMLLGSLGITVLPAQQAISGAHNAFNGNGQLTDKPRQQAVLELGEELAQTLSKIKGRQS